MRLGMLGPAKGDLMALACGAQVLVDSADVEKVIYLGDDDALDRVVAKWAHELVGADPGDSALFVRAAARCTKATPSEIDAFVASERARLRLQLFVTLPPPPQRTLEIFDGGRVAVFVFDKAALDEDDIAAASLLVYGKSAQPILKKVGSRTFLSPGPVAGPGGLAVLDDVGGGVRIELLNGKGDVIAREAIGAGSDNAKLRVQGGSGG